MEPTMKVAQFNGTGTRLCFHVPVAGLVGIDAARTRLQ